MDDLIDRLQSVYPLHATRAKTAFLTLNSSHYAFCELWREEAEHAELFFVPGLKSVAII